LLGMTLGTMTSLFGHPDGMTMARAALVMTMAREPLGHPELVEGQPGISPVQIMMPDVIRAQRRRRAVEGADCGRPARGRDRGGYSAELVTRSITSTVAIVVVPRQARDDRLRSGTTSNRVEQPKDRQRRDSRQGDAGDDLRYRVPR
jgi:hypothetical protein